MKQIYQTTLVILLWLLVLVVSDDNHGEEDNHIRRRTRVFYDVHYTDEGAEEAPVYSGTIKDLDEDFEVFQLIHIPKTPQKLRLKSSFAR